MPPPSTCFDLETFSARNSVLLKYCDGETLSACTMLTPNLPGASFAGSNSSVTKVNGTTLHWQGKNILHAAINDLLTHRTLANATDVVISGCSAGGWAHDYFYNTPTVPRF